MRVLLVLLLLLLCGSAHAQPVYQTADQTVTASSSQSATYDLTGDAPANLAEGDLIVGCAVSVNSNTTSTSVFTWPAGFTVIRSEHTTSSSFAPEAAAAWKIATGSEPSSYTVSFSQSNGGRSILLLGRVTGHDGAAPIDVSNGTNAGTNAVSTIDAPAVTVTDDDSLLITCTGAPRNVVTQVGNYTVTPMTLIAELHSGGTTTINFAAATQAVNSGSTGTRTTSWTDAGRAATLIFAVSPGVAATSPRRRIMMLRGY